MVEKVELKEVFQKPITGEWGSEGDKVKVLRTTNFTNSGVLDLTNVVLRDISDKKIEQKKLCKGDIIIEKSGGSPTQPVGRVVYFDEEGVYLCNNFTSVLRPQNGKAHSKYLLYMLFGSYQLGLTNFFQNKTTGISNLQLTRYLDKLKIPLPPLKTQQKIAQILDNAAALRDKTAQLIEEYNLLAQSIFLEMFGDPVVNPMGWEKVSLDKLGIIVTGSTPSSKKEDMFGGPIPFVTPSDLDSDAEYSRTVTEEGAKNSRVVKKGSLLVCCIGATIGKRRMVNTDVSFNQQINAIEWNERIKPEFGFHTFHWLKRVVIGKAKSTTLPILKKSEFQKIKMIVPDLELQTHFAQKIANIDAQKTLARQELKESQDLFNCLLQKAFKGEL